MNRQRGFTLLEMMVVLVIVGIMLGMISYNVMPDRHQRMQEDAQRIALLLQLAREEAIVRNRPIAFEAQGNAYHFLVRGERSWEALHDTDVLRDREFVITPMTLSMEPRLDARDDALRIVFGREPVDKAFVLTMSSGEDKVSIHADGIGHFVVD
jgi:general secretion pathway protein H